MDEKKLKTLIAKIILELNAWDQKFGDHASKNNTALNSVRLELLNHADSLSANHEQLKALLLELTRLTGDELQKIREEFGSHQNDLVAANGNLQLSVRNLEGKINAIPSNSTSDIKSRLEIPKVGETKYDLESLRKDVKQLKDVKQQKVDLSAYATKEQIRTIQEKLNIINSIEDAFAQINQDLGNRAYKKHKHKIEDVIGLQDALNSAGGGTTLPDQTGQSGKFLTTNGTTLSWGTPAGSGNITGPVSSTDTAIAKWNGTNGQTLQDSGITIDSSNNLVTPGNLRISTAVANRDMMWQTSGSNRWGIRANNTAESGGNAGSNFQLSRYDDTGTILDSPITISRSTGVVSFTNGIRPTGNDGGQLGTATLSFSDLFMATGAVLNYANGNVVLTHTSGILTLGTGDLQITTAGTALTSVVTRTGTQTLTNKDLSSGTNTFPTFNQNTTGSAGTLTTARNLAGNSFNGSADVPFANKFIVQGTTDAGLSGAQFLGALGTGIVKNTTTTGVLSIAAATDIPAAGSSGRVQYNSGGFLSSSGNFVWNTGNNMLTATGGLSDVNNNELIKFPAAVTSAVNEFTVSNAATGSNPTITASGGDTDVGLNLIPKGAGTIQVSGVPILTTTATQTLTNKRITNRIGTETSSATSTPTADIVDQWNVTALAVADAFAAPTGTPTDGQKLIIRIKDAGTAKALTWNAIYRASSDLALPSTTIINKTLYLGFIYNAADSKWDLIALLNNF